MKKTCFILASVLILTLLLPQVNMVSASDTITLKETEEVLKFTETLFYCFSHMDRAYIPQVEDEYHIYTRLYGNEAYLILDANDKKTDIEPGYKVHCVKAFTYEGKQYDISTFTKFKEFLRNYYTNDTAELFLNQFNGSCLIIDDNEDKVYHKWLYGGGSTGPRTKLIKSTNLVVSGDTASVNYEMFNSRTEIEEHAPDVPVFYYSFPAKFKKTQNGWRLDSLMFDFYYSEHANDYRIDNPSTSSPTPIYLTLAGAALVGVCLPVVKRKRRKAD